MTSSSSNLDYTLPKVANKSCVGEVKEKVFALHARLSSMHLRWYDLPLGTYRNRNFSKKPGCGEELNVYDESHL